MYVTASFAYYRFVHAFTCAGILPTQYIHFSKFAGVGKVGYGYIKQGIAIITFCNNIIYSSLSVYNRREYVEIVGRLTEHSMQSAVEEVQSRPEYATDGEVHIVHLTVIKMNVFSLFYLQWVITDARHDSTANAYHTTVPCLSGR